VLDALLRELRAGDVLVCWKLDRVGRSTRHLLEIVEDFNGRDVGLVATTQSIDTTTGMGRFFVTVLAAVAELEAGSACAPASTPRVGAGSPSVPRTK